MDSRIVEFKYTNIHGISIVINHREPFVLEKFSGLGQPNTKLDTQELYGMDGEYLTSKSIQKREIGLEFWIVADTFTELQEQKRTVIKAMNPNLTGTLTVRMAGKVYEIDVEIVSGVDEGSGGTATTQKAVIAFEALDPFWRDLSDYDFLVPLAEVKNEFTFPLSITESFTFASMEVGQLVTVVNPGDASVGMVLTFQFTGAVTDPRVYDVQKAQFLGFDGTFANGDVIKVSTIRNDKWMTYYPVGGGEENAMPLRQYGSTFLQLDNMSDNVFQVSAAGDTAANCFVTLEYHPLVLGV